MIFFFNNRKKKQICFISRTCFLSFSPEQKFLWLSCKPLKIGVYNGNTDNTLSMAALAEQCNIH